MRKLVSHLAVGCMTFAVSLFVTSTINLLRGDEIISQEPLRTNFRPAVAQSDPELAEIYRDYAATQTNHNRAFFERVETEDFTVFQVDGKTLSRTEAIEWLNSSPRTTVYEIDDMNMEVLGNAAIVTGRIAAINRDGETSRWRWLDVCVKRNGHWKIQSTTQLD